QEDLIYEHFNYENVVYHVYRTFKAVRLPRGLVPAYPRLYRRAAKVWVWPPVARQCYGTHPWSPVSIGWAERCNSRAPSIRERQKGAWSAGYTSCTRYSAILRLSDEKEIPRASFVRSSAV